MGMGLQLGGSVVAGQAAYEAGQYEGQINDMNAVLARRYAVDAVARGGVMAGRAEAQGTQVISSARAAGGASGFDVGSESMVDALATTRAMSTLDAKTIQSNSLREALGYETQAANFDAKAQLARYKGKMDRFATILGGVNSAGSSAMQLLPMFGA